MIQVFKPSMGQDEIDAVAEVIRSGWIGLGPKTVEFEGRFADYVGADHAVALNSATAALHLALEVFGISSGDEVLVPAISFVSTAHAVIYNQARPVFVDVEADTLCMDIDDMKRKISKRTKAIVPVHYGGYPCDLDAIHEVAERSEAVVIEDAAHACGSEYKGEKIGSISDATCFSFHAVKNLAVGDGGMITLNDKGKDKMLRKLRWVGINKSTWERTELVEEAVTSEREKYGQYGWYYDVDVLGYKYHLNDIAASIGLVQLEKLDQTNGRRREIVALYNQAFADVSWIRTPIEKEWMHSACHNYVIRTPYRDELNLYLRDQGIATGVHYMPIHLHPYYRKNDYDADVPIAEEVWKNLLTLPLYPDLTNKEVAAVIDAIKNYSPRD